MRADAAPPQSTTTLNTRPSPTHLRQIETPIETTVKVGDGAPSDAAESLAGLAAGVAGVAPDWRVAFYNRGFARALGARDGAWIGRTLWEMVPALAGTSEALRRTMHDGRARTARVRLAGADLELAIGRLSSGMLTLEVRSAGTAIAFADVDDPSVENGALRELAHAMTVVSDSGALLDMLLAAATAQCRAEAALLVRFEGDEGTFLAAVGIAAPLRGRRTLLAGTVLDDIAARRESRAFANAGAALIGAAETLLSGPALVAPLVAHDRTLGALVVVREEGGAVFGRREERQLRPVADHASLALWKEHLAAEADAANAAKSNFLATVSHELRTPLTTLTGYGELLADEIMGPMPAPQLEVVERMRAVTHELTSMIDEILTYSSIEAGREIVRRAPVSARELLAAVRAQADPVAKQKRIEFCIVGTPADVVVNTDGEKVRQILGNLVGNALKFTEHGCVHLSLTATERDARFGVRDTGPGINEEDQARLFQPFTQLDGGLTRRFGGAGLGLYISYRLSRLLGGRIEVESVPGNGSNFTLVVPL